MCYKHTLGIVGIIHVTLQCYFYNTDSNRRRKAIVIQSSRRTVPSERWMGQFQKGTRTSQHGITILPTGIPSWSKEKRAFGGLHFSHFIHDMHGLCLICIVYDVYYSCRPSLTMIVHYVQKSSASKSEGTTAPLLLRMLDFKRTQLNWAASAKIINDRVKQYWEWSKPFKI